MSGPPLNARWMSQKSKTRVIPLLLSCIIIIILYCLADFYNLKSKDDLLRSSPCRLWFTMPSGWRKWVLWQHVCFIFHLNVIFLQDSEDILQILLYTTLCHSDWLFWLYKITVIEKSLEQKKSLLLQKYFLHTFCYMWIFIFWAKKSEQPY